MSRPATPTAHDDLVRKIREVCARITAEGNAAGLVAGIHLTIIAILIRLAEMIEHWRATRPIANVEALVAARPHLAGPANLVWVPHTPSQTATPRLRPQSRQYPPHPEQATARPDSAHPPAEIPARCRQKPGWQVPIPHVQLVTISK